MIKVDNVEVWGFDHAVRGARNPMKSWARSDSFRKEGGAFHIGEKDLALLRKLFKAGREHRKFLRQIFVSMDVQGPIFWWLQFDTYKIGVTTSGTSKMHKLHSEPITAESFSLADFRREDRDIFELIVKACEMFRKEYVTTGNAYCWDALLRLLPESYNQMRTVTMNYENVANILSQRSNHKLQEWHEFCDVLRGLPGVKEIMLDSEENNDVLD